MKRPFRYDATGRLRRYLRRDACAISAIFDLFAPQARYTPEKKFDLVAAVRTGVLTAERAQQIHQISPEEWAAWEAGAARGSARFLRVTGQEARYGL